MPKMLQSFIKFRAECLWLIFVVLTCCPGALISNSSEIIPIAIFRSPSCMKCESIKKPVLEKMGSKLGVELDLKYYDIDDIENYKLLLKVEKELGTEIMNFRL